MKIYQLKVNGITHEMQMDASDAEAQGAVPVPAASKRSTARDKD